MDPYGKHGLAAALSGVAAVYRIASGRGVRRARQAPSLRLDIQSVAGICRLHVLRPIKILQSFCSYATKKRIGRPSAVRNFAAHATHHTTSTHLTQQPYEHPLPHHRLHRRSVRHRNRNRHHLSSSTRMLAPALPRLPPVPHAPSLRRIPARRVCPDIHRPRHGGPRQRRSHAPRSRRMRAGALPCRLPPARSSLARLHPRWPCAARILF